MKEKYLFVTFIFGFVLAVVALVVGHLNMNCYTWDAMGYQYSAWWAIPLLCGRATFVAGFPLLLIAEVLVLGSYVALRKQAD